jgi:hypothetical protein
MIQPAPAPAPLSLGSLAFAGALFVIAGVLIVLFSMAIFKRDPLIDHEDRTP